VVIEDVGQQPRPLTTSLPHGVYGRPDAMDGAVLDDQREALLASGQQRSGR